MAGPRQQQPPAEHKDLSSEGEIDFSVFLQEFKELKEPNLKEAQSIPFFIGWMENRQTYQEMLHLTFALSPMMRISEANNVIDSIKNFLATRWQRIRGTQHCYTQIPDHPYSELCIYLAQQLAPLVKKNVFQLLMPSLENLSSPVTGSSLEEESSSIKLFVLNDDEKYPIHVVECLDYFNDGKLLHTHQLKPNPDKNGILDPVPLSATEAYRVINHSDLTLKYYNASMAKKCFVDKGASLYAELEKLAQQLNQGDAYHIYNQQELPFEQHQVKPKKVASDAIRDFRNFLHTLNREQQDTLFRCRGPNLNEGQNFKDIWLRLIAGTDGIEYTEEETQGMASLPPTEHNTLTCVFNCAADIRTILRVNEHLFNDIKKLEEVITQSRKKLSESINKEQVNYKVYATYPLQTSNTRLLSQLVRHVIIYRKTLISLSLELMSNLLQTLPKTDTDCDRLLDYLEFTGIALTGFMGDEKNCDALFNSLTNFPPQSKIKFLNFFIRSLKEWLHTTFFYFLSKLVSSINDIQLLTSFLASIQQRYKPLLPNLLHRSIRPDRLKFLDFILTQPLEKIELLINFLKKIEIPKNIAFIPFDDEIKIWLREKQASGGIFSAKDKKIIPGMVKIAKLHLKFLIRDQRELLFVLENISKEEQSSVIDMLGWEYLKAILVDISYSVAILKLLLPHLTVYQIPEFLRIFPNNNFLAYIILNIDKFLAEHSPEKIHCIFNYVGLSAITDEATSYARKRVEYEEKDISVGKEEKSELEGKEEKQIKLSEKPSGFLSTLPANKFAGIFVNWSVINLGALFTAIGWLDQSYPKKTFSIDHGIITFLNLLKKEDAEYFLKHTSLYFICSYSRVSSEGDFFNWLANILETSTPFLYLLIFRNLQKRVTSTFKTFLLSDLFLQAMTELYSKDAAVFKEVLTEFQLQWLHRPLVQFKNGKISWPKLFTIFTDDEKKSFREFVNSFSLSDFKVLTESYAFFMSQKFVIAERQQEKNIILEEIKKALIADRIDFEKIDIIISSLTDCATQLFLILKSLNISRERLFQKYTFGYLLKNFELLPILMLLKYFKYHDKDYFNTQFSVYDWVTAIEELFYKFGHNACHEFVGIINPELAYLMLTLQHTSLSNISNSICEPAGPRENSWHLSVQCRPQSFLYFLQVLLKGYIHKRTTTITSQLWGPQTKTAKLEAASFLEVIIRGQPEVESTLTPQQLVTLKQGELGIVYSLFKNYVKTFPEDYALYLENQPGREGMRALHQSAAVDDKVIEEKKSEAAPPNQQAAPGR